MMSTQAAAYLTVDEYLKLERAAEFRSEYIQGQIIAMSGASRNHVRIAAAALSLLYDQLRGGPGEAFGSDLRLHIPAHNVFTYPAVVVTCGGAGVRDLEEDFIEDATFITEVLSPSTANYDRGEKFRYYRSLPSFTEYLLFAQEAIRAEHHVRQADRSWVFREITGVDAVIDLASIGCRLPLADVYERVLFETLAAPPARIPAV